MRVLARKDSLGCGALLVDYGLNASGKTYDDAIYDLQVRIASHIAWCIEHSVEHVWREIPDAALSAAWDAASPQLYAHVDFRLDGKRLELPTLNVRVP